MCLFSKLFLIYAGSVKCLQSIQNLIPTLPLATRNTLFSKQISRLSIKLSVKEFFLLSQTGKERKALVVMCKKKSCIVRLSPRPLGRHGR